VSHITRALPVPEFDYKETLGAALVRAAERWPDRDFVVLPDRRMTFADMEAASRRLGKELLASGVGKGARIGIWDTYSVEWVVAWFAVMRIGGIAMPCSSIYKPAELSTVMRIGDMHTMLIPPSFLGKDTAAMLEEAVPSLTDSEAPYFVESHPYLRQVWCWGPSSRTWARQIDLDTIGSRVSDEVFRRVEAEVVPADWAQVTYTSGSSALPKGVVHSHGAIVRTTGAPMTVLAANPGASSDDERRVGFCAFPFFWIGGTLVLGGAVQAGRTVVCVPKFESGPALDMIERERCTSVTGWTSIVQQLRGNPSVPNRDLTHIPMLDPSPEGVAAQMAQMAAYFPPLPGAQGHRSMSELVGNWAGAERKVIDPETGETLPDLVEGELLVRGFGALQGYYKKEREQTFDEDGWLHTGDRVVLHENRPFFVGRYFEMVKSQGANVAPLEVEAVIQAWPEIKHCFVFGTPHPTLEEEVCAVVAFMPGESMTVDEIRSRAARELSSYKVPTRIELVTDESTLPWLGSGKPDKLTLKARLLGLPDPESAIPKLTF
jgi:acyl-CoA synthetase (AMP-forming)/AMP-acid ligase II